MAIAQRNGPLLGPAVREEFAEHADEELRHADMLAERIQQPGGVPTSVRARASSP